ncbi:MAG TPA: DUF302 domain-containing protein [Terriglobales bacterium]|nr:DUF302 domain-containing protein [Terriglobales bacterium]
MSVAAGKEGNGVVSVRSQHPFAETMQKLERTLTSKGMKIFATIDLSGEAVAAGFRMPPTKLVIFGNPKLGTPVMLGAPSTALDLPQKILVGEDPGRQTWLSYNSPAYLAKRHSIPDDLLQNISGIEALVQAVAN